MEDAIENAAVPEASKTSYRLSWVAYIRPVVVFLVLWLISVTMPWVYAAPFFILAVTYLIYRVLETRSVRLYTDDEGVWCYAGILPWKKGLSGVRWRDMDVATFYPGFTSWALGSYKIRIGHRFTKSSEIYLSHVRQGVRVAAAINEEHRLRIAEMSS